VAFAPADLETAERLSPMLRQTTVHLAKRALDGAALVLQWHTLSLQEVARPLLAAEEVRRRPDGRRSCSVRHPAIRGRHEPYFADAEMVGCWVLFWYFSAVGGRPSFSGLRYTVCRTANARRTS
jgi:type IV secretory pathway TraG/TraD family ATPase VirD4